MSSKTKSTLQWLIITLLGLTGLIILVIAFLLYSKFNTLPWEAPHTLTNKLDTIAVHNINWACDCAEWGIVDEVIPEDSLLEDYAIFIEAAPGVTKYEDANLPNKCWPHKLQLIGQFYAEKGISRDYKPCMKNRNMQGCLGMIAIMF